MASLKDINEEIIKGNEDLERLNKNFEAWIKSQQPTGDDLEAKREAKKALSSVGFKQVFRKDAQKKTGGSGGLFGTGLSAKGLLGLTALIGPLLITIFRKEIGDLLKNLIPKIPGFTTDDGQVEFPDNPSSMPFSGKTLQIAIRSLQGNLKNQILKYNKLLSETRSLRLQVRTLTSSSLGKVGGKPTVPNRPPPLSISGRPGTNKPGEGFTRSGVNNRKYLPNIPPGKNPRDFDAKTAKQYGNRFGAKTLGGGFQYITEEQFKKLKPNASGFSDQNPQKAPKPGIRSSMLTSVNRVLQKVLPAFDEKETFRALVQANLFPDQKRFPNAFAYGSAIFDYIKQYTPGPIKTIARVLFHPAVMRIIFSAAVFGEIGLILANKKIVLKGVFTGEKMLVNANYTIAEQIVGVGALISGFAGGALGSSIGGMIGAIAGPLGIFTGAVIGGYLGFKSGYFIAKFLFDLAFKKKNGIAFYKKELEVFQKAKKGVQLNQGMMAMNSGGMKDSTLK